MKTIPVSLVKEINCFSQFVQFKVKWLPTALLAGIQSAMDWRQTRVDGQINLNVIHIMLYMTCNKIAD